MAGKKNKKNRYRVMMFSFLAGAGGERDNGMTE